MDTNETPTENPPSAKCESCGKAFSSEFKFCPYCGRVTAGADGEAPPSAADAAGGKAADRAGGKEENISPEARRALEAFNRQFEEMKQKHEKSLTKKKNNLGFDTNVNVIMAIVGGALLIFMLIMAFYVIHAGKAIAH